MFPKKCESLAPAQLGASLRTSNGVVVPAAQEALCILILPPTFQKLGLLVFELAPSSRNSTDQGGAVRLTVREYQP